MYQSTQNRIDSTPIVQDEFDNEILVEPNRPAKREDGLQESKSKEVSTYETPEKHGQFIFEPLDQNPYELTYACLLIPRFSSHILYGDLVDHLRAGIKRICISFGWRLEFLNIKSDYLQWALRVPATTSPVYFIRVIRRETSSTIFEEFPRIRRENISDDFWAPGYMIQAGSQPHAAESVRKFIHQTRLHQGIKPNE